jgi:hypothetical protein
VVQVASRALEGGVVLVAGVALAVGDRAAGEHAAAEGLVATGDGVGVGNVGGGDGAVEVGVLADVVAGGGADPARIGRVPVAVAIRVAGGQREWNAVG